MPDDTLGYLAAGFAVAWILMAAYVVRLWRLQQGIVRRLDDLDRGPDTSAPSAPTDGEPS